MNVFDFGRCKSGCWTGKTVRPISPTCEDMIDVCRLIASSSKLQHFEVHRRIRFWSLKALVVQFQEFLKHMRVFNREFLGNDLRKSFPKTLPRAGELCADVMLPEVRGLSEAIYIQNQANRLLLPSCERRCQQLIRDLMQIDDGMTTVRYCAEEKSMWLARMSIFIG